MLSETITNYHALVNAGNAMWQIIGLCGFCLFSLAVGAVAERLNK